MADAPTGLTIAGLRSRLAGPFDLRVERGQAVAISGASGSGKSLFLRMIADLDSNDGEVALGEQRRRDMPASRWRRLVPYVGAESGWWADAVMQHLAPEAAGPARALAARLGVGPEQFDGPVARLSTGERQRLSIVRALVLDAPALLLDEPTGPLDPESTAKVEALLQERLASGLVLILVTHDGAQAERLGARRLRMADRHLEPVE